VRLSKETPAADLAAVGQELERLSPTSTAKEKGQAKRKPLPVERHLEQTT